jgi:uncharacterized ferritin-like protein (DUF455 family)
MEIREFAERVLFGTTWEEKLIRPQRCDDRYPGAPVETPRVPGRPAALELDNWQERDKLHFADVRQLHSEKERGLVLHFFANHELLALELMALALLKFPAAPDKFRRGLLQTLRDEQEHLRLYQERMQQVGVAFGEIPVSDFFWKSISPMQSPMDFVTRLSLTLEQANLDYAVHYARIYRELADGDTAAILDRVYRDEIGHVKHGLIWFNRWRDPQESEWEAYRRALDSSLTPNRAKGIGFNREGRRQAGLSDPFIDELELYSRSRGRCPGVYWFNPACEGQVALGRVGFTPSRPVQLLARDFEALPMLLCAQDDVVLVRQRPSSGFLRQLQRAGFPIPEFAEYGGENLARTELAQRRISSLRPWGWSPDGGRLLEPLRANLPEGQAGLWNEAMQRLYSKAWSAALLGKFLRAHSAEDDWLCAAEVVGVACATRAEVLARAEEFGNRGFEQVVVKAAFGASGQNQVHFFGGQLREGQLRWVENLLKEQGSAVVEPWLDKVVDLSAQLDMVAPGAARVLGWSRFFTDPRGQYCGSFVHGRMAGLDTATRKFLYGQGRDPKRLQRLFEDLGGWVAGAMADSGYVGPVGIDLLVYRTAEGLRLKPIVEVNPRFTMGRVALHLGRRVNSARAAVWLVLSTKDIAAAGFASAAAFADYMEERCPARMMPDGDQLAEGVLFTTDPGRAQAFVSMLAVGESLEVCKGYFKGLSGKLDRWADYC